MLNDQSSYGNPQEGRLGDMEMIQNLHDLPCHRIQIGRHIRNFVGTSGVGGQLNENQIILLSQIACLIHPVGDAATQAVYEDKYRSFKRYFPALGENVVTQ
jgi:hypothetical protein